MYNYKVDLGSELVDLDRLMDIIGGEECLHTGKSVSLSNESKLRADLKYLFGEGGYKFIVETLQEQVDNIKARQPSAKE